MFNVLVVEDDLKLNKLYCNVLSKNGYRPLPAFDGQEALDIMDKEYVDLIISDIMMPQVDGYELAETLRKFSYTQPILFISAKDQYEDKKKGFSAGIDDYMVKPIDVNEMILRIGALLRRAQIISDHKITCGNTILNFDALTVTIGINEILLPQKEFLLLYKLISFTNVIFTRQQIMDEIWGMDSETDERTVDVHINRIRERLKECTDFQIITVRGLGYKAVRLSS